MARAEPHAELVTVRRELQDAERRLLEKKAEAKKKRQLMEAKWRDLERKEEMLKESFIKFNKV